LSSRGNLDPMTRRVRGAVSSSGDSRALLRRMLLLGAPLSRAELAERTGLSRPAITDICRELLDQGLIQATGALTPARSAVGRRRVQLDLCADAGYALGVLVAAENSALTIVDLKGQVVDTVRIQPPSDTPERVLAFLAAAAAARLRAAGVDRARLVGVGVSVPGVVDSRAGRLRLSPFFGWVDVPVRPAFESIFGPRVSVASPLHAIAVAEMLFGSAARLPSADLVLVNVSTAIGAAFVMGGRLQHGADSASGQIGHVPVDGEGGRWCSCGRRGCLDAVASGDALVTIAAEQGRPYASFSVLLASAEAGDAFALDLVDESARRVGTVVGDLITTLNPAVVAISGMVLQLGARYVDRVRRVAFERAWLVGAAQLRIVPSAFGVHAGGVGAAAIALEDFVYTANWPHSPAA
jgi:predicted NBD/HSP70 family sugar kinase